MSKLVLAMCLMLPATLLSLVIWIFGGWTDKYRVYPADKLLEWMMK